MTVQNIKYLLAACGSALLLGACSTAANTEKADAKPDARQGEEVKQICFNQQIRNWRENDSRSVIVEKGMKEEYKLELIGTCQPDQAFSSIGLVSRMGGGSCLTTGDQLITDSRFNEGSCSIRRIYKWNKDAGQEKTAAAS